jgi:hypothetical protein
MHSLYVAIPARERGPLVKSAPYVRLIGASLQAGPANVAVANFNDYVWISGENYSTEIDITTPCAIRFEAPRIETVRYGPFPGVCLVGLSIYFGPRYGEVLGCYDREKHQWLVCRERKHFDTVVIESVERVAYRRGQAWSFWTGVKAA